MCVTETRIERTLLWESLKDVGQHSHMGDHKQLLCSNSTESSLIGE